MLGRQEGRCLHPRVWVTAKTQSSSASEQMKFVVGGKNNTGEHPRQTAFILAIYLAHRKNRTERCAIEMNRYQGTLRVMKPTLFQSAHVQLLYTDSTVNKTVFLIRCTKEVHELCQSHLTRRCRIVDALAQEAIGPINKGTDTCL